MKDDVGEELQLLASWLESRENVRSVSILASPIEPVALLVRKRFPEAALQLVVENARELEAVRGKRQFHGAVSALGSHFGAFEQKEQGSANLAIMRVTGYEGKGRLRERISSARQQLSVGGQLAVLTHTRRGARSQLALIKEALGCANVAERGRGGFRILEGCIREKGAPVALSLPRDGTESARGWSKISEAIVGGRFDFWTQAGVFSRKRIDPGTRLLLETLPPVAPRRILDLGCGYGVMGIVLARLHPASRVTMVDVDVQAVELTRANVTLNQVETNTRVVLSSGLRQLPWERSQLFDMVVIHFPLHIPQEELEQLLTEARDILEPGGCLYGVMLGAYELESLVLRVFGNVETLREKRSSEFEHAYSLLRACHR